LNQTYELLYTYRVCFGCKATAYGVQVIDYRVPTLGPKLDLLAQTCQRSYLGFLSFGILFIDY